MTERGPNADAAESRWLTCALLAVWAVIGSWSAWQLFVLWAFSTMIDPRITGSERTHFIADRVLWGDGVAVHGTLTVAQHSSAPLRPLSFHYSLGAAQKPRCRL